MPSSADPRLKDWVENHHPGFRQAGIDRQERLRVDDAGGERHLYELSDVAREIRDTEATDEAVAWCRRSNELYRRGFSRYERHAILSRPAVRTHGQSRESRGCSSRTRGSRRVTRSSARSGDSGDDAGGESDDGPAPSAVVSLAAPFGTPYGGANRALRDWLRVRGLA